RLSGRAAAVVRRLVREAALDVWGRQEEVLVAQIGRQVVPGDEALDLVLDLSIGEAVRRRAGDARQADWTLACRIRVRVDQHAAESHLVFRPRSGLVVVLRTDRVDV